MMAVEAERGDVHHLNMSVTRRRCGPRKVAQTGNDPKAGETRRVRLFSLISLFAQSFSRMKAPAGGPISLFSHKVHSFFGKLPSGNTEVKPRRADGTARVSVWERR